MSAASAAPRAADDDAAAAAAAAGAEHAASAVRKRKSYKYKYRPRPENKHHCKRSRLKWETASPEALEAGRRMLEDLAKAQNNAEAHCAACAICVEDIAEATMCALPCCPTARACKTCMQRIADAAGQGVRCPFCSATSPTFLAALSAQEISTHLSRPSVWASEDSVVVDADPLACSTPHCRCPGGREWVSPPVRGTRHTDAPEAWDLRKCASCGQCGVHWPQCAFTSAQKKRKREPAALGWVCDACTVRP